jgi:hypothetical protein
MTAAVFAALAAGFSGTLAVLGKVAAAAVLPAAGLAAMLAAVAVLAALAAGLGRQRRVSGETALFGGYALPAFAARFRGALRIAFEIPAAGVPAFAGNFPLPLFVHRRETAVCGMRLVAIWHNNPR